MTDFITMKIHRKGKSLSEYSQDVQAAMPKLVKKYAFRIQANTASKVRVDTGTYKNSIAAKPTSEPKRWEIMDGVNYGIYNELGTSRMTGDHSLGNACESNAEPFFNAIRRQLRKEPGAGGDE